MRDAHTIQVLFDDGDSLITRIYGSVMEIMRHYSGTFTDNQERSRKVKLVSFIG